MTESFRLRRRWGTVIVVQSLLTGGTLVALWSLAQQAALAMAPSGPHAKPYLLPSIIGFALFVILLDMYLCWIPLRDLLCEFTANGIARPGPLGPLSKRTVIAWKDLRQVEIGDSTLGLVGEHEAIRLNGIIFIDPRELIAVVRQNAPPESLPAWMFPKT